MQSVLTGIGETLLIPLWARAAETRRADPIVRDTKAVEMVARIKYDFSKFEKSKMTQLGVAIRTMLLDGAVNDFMQRAAGAVVVNLGAGLDTRRDRLGCAAADWYELDVPESIALRRRFLPNRRTIILSPGRCSTPHGWRRSGIRGRRSS